MFEFLPENLRNLSGVPLYATIVWLSLILLIGLLIILVKPLKRLLTKQDPTNSKLKKTLKEKTFMVKTKKSKNNKGF